MWNFPKMDLVLILKLILSVFVFYQLWTRLPELSVLPLGLVLSSVMCYAFYMADRRGFKGVDTVALLNANPHLYVQYMRIYAFLIGLGFTLAFCMSRL